MKNNEKVPMLTMKKIHNADNEKVPNADNCIHIPWLVHEGLVHGLGTIGTKRVGTDVCSSWYMYQLVQNELVQMFARATFVPIGTCTNWYMYQLAEGLLYEWLMKVWYYNIVSTRDFIKCQQYELTLLSALGTFFSVSIHKMPENCQNLQKMMMWAWRWFYSVQRVLAGISLRRRCRDSGCVSIMNG